MVGAWLKYHRTPSRGAGGNRLVNASERHELRAGKGWQTRGAKEGCGHLLFALPGSIVVGKPQAVKGGKRNVRSAAAFPLILDRFTLPGSRCSLGKR